MSPQDRKRYQWKYVFAMYFMHKIVWIDDTLQQDAQLVLQEMFPQELLTALELTETQQMSVLFEESLTQIPQKLPIADKMDIIGMCFATASAKGTVNPAEIAVIQVAAEKMGVSNEDLFAYIQTLLD